MVGAGTLNLIHCPVYCAFMVGAGTLNLIHCPVYSAFMVGAGTLNLIQSSNYGRINRRIRTNARPSQKMYSYVPVLGLYAVQICVKPLTQAVA